MMRFSVIIPTWNRPKELVRCLQSFTRLGYPASDWELIVVNDGGEESFTSISRKLQNALPLRLVHNDHAGPAAARNAGARLARHAYLAFTDDDCQVSPDWLKSFAKGFQETGADALGGKALNPFPNDLGAQASQYLIDFFYRHMQDESGNALMLVSNNAAYRRSVFETLGGFDETFPLAAAEDMEISYRSVIQGFRQQYYPAAQVTHYHQLMWQGHIRQQFRYGRGGYYFLQARKRIPQARPIRLASATPFYITLGQSMWRDRLPWSLCLLIGIAQLAYRAGQFSQRCRRHTQTTG